MHEFKNFSTKVFMVVSLPPTGHLRKLAVIDGLSKLLGFCLYARALVAEPRLRAAQHLKITLLISCLMPPERLDFNYRPSPGVCVCRVGFKRILSRLRNAKLIEASFLE